MLLWIGGTPYNPRATLTPTSHRVLTSGSVEGAIPVYLPLPCIGATFASKGQRPMAFLPFLVGPSCLFGASMQGKRGEWEPPSVVSEPQILQVLTLLHQGSGTFWAIYSWSQLQPLPCPHPTLPFPFHSINCSQMTGNFPALFNFYRFFPTLNLI